MCVNKEFYSFIKSFYEKIIYNRYNIIASKLEKYFIAEDVHNILVNSYSKKQISKIALDQLTIINNHPKTLKFFGRIHFYVNFSYTRNVNLLIDWLIALHRERSVNICSRIICFRQETSYECILLKIIKNFVGNLTSDAILKCEC